MIIGRNDLCPCGSGKKYKNCCLKRNKFDDPISQIQQTYKDARHHAQFKECLHPDKGSCSERIIRAHSIQRKRHLSKISENGVVIMPCPKPDLRPGIMEEYGVSEASIFTGFCSLHDKTLFQPIEDHPFVGTEQQLFLLAYRAFALEYHKKKEASSMFESWSNSNMNSNAINGFALSVMDFEDEKKLFDDAILSAKYDAIKSIVWSFDGESHVAATGAEILTYDLSHKHIQSLIDTTKCLKHMYYSCFPENGKTYFIISWLRKYNDLFSNHVRNLSSLSLSQKRNYANYTLALVTENIAIKPSAWHSMDRNEKTAFEQVFCGMYELSEFYNQPVDRIEDPGFDLFAL